MAEGLGHIVEDPADEAHLTAVMDMIGRTGAKHMQIRYSDDEKPLVWFLVAQYDPTPSRLWESASGPNPIEAGYRLIERLIDGGICQHCERPSGLNRDWQDDMPLDKMFCWYSYDPELKKIRRGCESADA